MASSLFDIEQEEVKLNEDENSMDKHKMNLGDILNELNLDLADSNEEASQKSA